MDPEIVKTATEIAKATGTAAGLSIPFTSIVRRMLGPAADELAEMWRDRVRLYRYERQLKCVQKAERMAQDAGFTPQAVPPKILFPLLEGASFEDNEDLHTMWAALLANAASPENAGKVRPGFIVILKGMSPDEAALLKWLVDHRTSPSGDIFNAPFEYAELMLAYHRVVPYREIDGVKGLDHLDFEVCLNDLEAARLIEPKPETEGSLFLTPYPRALTFRSLAFVDACSPPDAKENG
jgi:hypothetical protein